MAPTYVALDIETTGLDPEVDEITEVAAVKFDEERVLDTFHTLLNPHRAMPYRIERLTGISPDSLREAPSFASVAGDLAVFLADLPLVGQNLAFDVSFLERRGRPAAGPASGRAARPPPVRAGLERLAALAGWGLRFLFRELQEAQPRSSGLEIRDSSPELR